MTDPVQHPSEITRDADDKPDGDHPVRFWYRYRKGQGWRTDVPGGPPGEELAALRSGLGREAASAPAMWPHYTTPTDGGLNAHLVAEHSALALYGLHQQSQSTPMHQRGIGLGRALHALRLSDRYSSDALDRRVAATVESNGLPPLLYRLRMLIPNLRAAAQPLDYDLLMQELVDWQRPDQRQLVRRKWGLEYYVWGPQTEAAKKARKGAPSDAPSTT
ncbi:type I-E CRISPR-associated protein Cse2/CasB [Streptomyces albidoflavus]|uniref:type I-E CRISPR-associated protein Cse2/CasB n=1 Tax=Streptomyces albidoflavus TaxID=1886 RepID=UPI0032525C1C